MSLQWTLVASVLYVEIGMVLLLLFPFISPKKWQRFLKSRFLQVLSNQAQWYFAVLLLILTLFLLDAIREIRKYSNREIHEHAHHLENEMQISMKLFRAQRNFYISGFALFLSLVIRRLVVLISSQATLMAEKEAALKQADSASTMAKKLINQEKQGEAEQNSTNEAHQIESVKLTAKISLLEDEIEKLKTDKQAVIEQAKGLETEYDRLSEEHQKLQLKLKIQGSGSGDKKDE